MKLVSNSSPLIFLAKLNELRLLKHHQIIVPKTVQNELFAKESSECDLLRKFFTQKNVTVMYVKQKRDFSTVLGKGEMETINCALQKKILYVLMDDRRARTFARLHNLHTKGTLWIILNAWKTKLITKKYAKQLIYELPSKGFRIEEGFLLNVIRGLG